MSNISNLIPFSTDGINGAIQADTVMGKFPTDMLVVGYIILAKDGSPAGDGIYRLKSINGFLATAYGAFDGANQRVQVFDTNASSPVGYLLYENVIIPAGEDLKFTVSVPDSGSVTLKVTAILMPL